MKSPQTTNWPTKTLQDRYYGRSDPVANKILSQYSESQGLKPPEDESIMSLFLSSLASESTEQSIRARILQSLPSIDSTKLKSVVHVAKTRCAFVNFKDRETAERAAQAWAAGLEIDDQQVAVKWGRSRPKPAAASVATSA
ncbi:Pre-mRNA-splicing factor slt11 [Paramarasmius palmivorus]|uniref:Pre-mRNA-splicing factor slt11 n=1 Tax=Paramarasmius palmivorus TaxID=297713 RepID=A0AAW0DTZ7_9AGAR